MVFFYCYTQPIQKKKAVKKQPKTKPVLKFSPLFCCSKMAQIASTKIKSRLSSYAPAQIQTCPAIVACAFGPSLLVPHSEKCMYVARALAHTPLLLLELARATLVPVSVVGPNCCLSRMTKQRHECSDKTERSPAPAADMGAAPTAALLAKARPC